MNDTRPQARYEGTPPDINNSPSSSHQAYLGPQVRLWPNVLYRARFNADEDGRD